MERYYITKNINTSYEDTGKLTPEERKILIGFIKENQKAQEEAIKETQQKMKHKR